MKKFFRNIWEFLKSRTFLINFGASLLVGILLVWLVFWWLNVYTRHGKTVAVPDFLNQTISQLPDFVKGKDVEYQIADSIYDPSKPKGIVFRQDPAAGEQVKSGRTIYLSVTAVMPPKIAMPNLETMSLRAAVIKLNSYGLKLEKSVQVKDVSCKGCIVKQLYNGKRIEPGTLIEKGSKIVLHVGSGPDDGGDGGEISVPNLVGKTFCDARSQLEMKGLTWTIVPLGGSKLKDTCDAVVVRQTPAAGSERKLGSGQSVDLYLSNDKKMLSSDSLPD